MVKKNENSIIIVIVIYNVNLEDCITFKTLINYISNSNLIYDLIIFNNSNEIKIPQNKSYKVVNSNENKKLSGAYNYALSYARENDKDWILLLDQDTELTEDYFSKLTLYFNSTPLNSEIVSIIPFLIENSKTISPHKIGLFNFKDSKVINPGIQHEHITAFNSLSLLNVEFMLSLGGFNIEYPLDMLDHWYYLQIYNCKKKVYVLDTYIEHKLSLSSYENNVSIERHRSILKAEKAFTKELGRTHYLLYKIKLTIRLISQFIFFKDKRYASIIFKTLIGKL
jgi:GT2 family glycosyltransferase